MWLGRRALWECGGRNGREPDRGRDPVWHVGKQTQSRDLRNSEIQEAQSLQRDIASFSEQHGSSIIADANGNEVIVRRVATADDFSIQCLKDGRDSTKFQISDSDGIIQTYKEDEMLDVVLDFVTKGHPPRS
jgi:hypothetical protein